MAKIRIIVRNKNKKKYKFNKNNKVCNYEKNENKI